MTEPRFPSASAAFAAIDALDLEPIKFKLKKEEGWSDRLSDQVELLYKQFLKLNVKYPDRSIVPTREIDTLWHHHILDTRKYAVDCDAIFGGFFHHFPYFGLRGDDDAVALKSAFNATIALYQSEFAADPTQTYMPGSKLVEAAASCSDCSGIVAEHPANFPASCSDCSGATPLSDAVHASSLIFEHAAASCSDCSGLSPASTPSRNTEFAGASCSDCSGVSPLAP